MFPCVFFKLSDGSLESNTLSIASLDLALQGSLCLFLQGCALAHPASLPCFLGSQPLLPLGRLMLRELWAPGSTPWGGASVSSLVSFHSEGPPSTSISGWTHGACSHSGRPFDPQEPPSAPGSLGSEPPLCHSSFLFVPFPPLPASQFPEGLWPRVTTH